MLNPMTTSFVDRLRRNDEAAWFELWETFGPVLRAQLTKWGNGRIGRETVRDLSQETMASALKLDRQVRSVQGCSFFDVATGNCQACAW